MSCEEGRGADLLRNTASELAEKHNCADHVWITLYLCFVDGICKGSDLETMIEFFDNQLKNDNTLTENTGNTKIAELQLIYTPNKKTKLISVPWGEGGKSIDYEQHIVMSVLIKKAIDAERIEERTKETEEYIYAINGAAPEDIDAAEMFYQIIEDNGYAYEVEEIKNALFICSREHILNWVLAVYGVFINEDEVDEILKRWKGVQQISGSQTDPQA